MRVSTQRNIHSEDIDFTTAETIFVKPLKDTNHIVFKITADDININLYMTCNNTQKLIKSLADAIVVVEG